MFSSLAMFQQLRFQKLGSFISAIGPDPTGPPPKIPSPYSMHTGFNPSKSGFIQQHLEDCGPMHNVGFPEPPCLLHIPPPLCSTSSPLLVFEHLDASHCDRECEHV